MTPEASANSRGPTPCLVDARLREAPLSLAELRRMVPLRLRTPNVTSSWRALGGVLAMAGICLGLLGFMGLDGGAALLWQAPALAAVWIFYGWVLVGLFALGHDCGHGSFSNRKWVNTLIGHLCMSPLGNSLVAWQIAHDHHHRHTQLQGQEVDWSANLRTRAQMRSPAAGNPLLVRSGYRLPCGMVVWIVSNTLRRAFNLRSMMTSVEWRAWKKPLRRSKLSMYLSVVLIYGGLWLWVGFWDMLDGGAALLWQAPALALVWIIYGWVLVGLFSLGHDCGHGCFSNRKWINTLIGHLCMSPLGNSLVAWQIAHDHHHRHTQLQGQEVDWSANLRTRAQMRSPSAGNPLLLRSGYRLPCGMVVWIVSNTLRRAFNLRSMMTSVEWRAWKKPLRRSKLSMYLSVVLIYGGLWLWVGFWDMLKYHGVPAAIAMLTGSFIITIQHANFRSLVYTADGWDPARSQMASTFDVRFPKWVEYLWCNINIHIPHHVAPEIPWYHLPESACILSAALPGRYMESRFGVEHLKFFWRTPFLEPVEDKGYFILDSASGV